MIHPGAGLQPVDLGDSGHCDRAARLLDSLQSQMQRAVLDVHYRAPLITHEELHQELIASLLQTAACGRGRATPALLIEASGHLAVWAEEEQAFRDLPRSIDAGQPAPSAEEVWFATDVAAAPSAVQPRRSHTATATSHKETPHA